MDVETNMEKKKKREERETQKSKVHRKAKRQREEDPVVGSKRDKEKSYSKGKYLGVSKCPSHPIPFHPIPSRPSCKKKKEKTMPKQVNKTRDSQP
jgi:hypothetical protein